MRSPKLFFAILVLLTGCRAAALTIDGDLSEPEWSHAQLFSDFVSPSRTRWRSHGIQLKFGCWAPLKGLRSAFSAFNRGVTAENKSRRRGTQ